MASLMLTSQRRRCCRCGAPAGSAASSRCPAGISRVPTGWRGSSRSGWDRATGLAVRRTSSNSKIRRLGAETGSGRGLGELILDRSLAGSLFANRFLGEFSRLNFPASKCALCRQNVSHSRVGGPLCQPLAIIRTISAHRGGKHGSITVRRLSDGEWELEEAAPSPWRIYEIHGGPDSLRWFWSLTVIGPMTRSDRVAT